MTDNIIHLTGLRTQVAAMQTKRFSLLILKSCKSPVDSSYLRDSPDDQETTGMSHPDVFLDFLETRGVGHPWQGESR